MKREEAAPEGLNNPTDYYEILDLKPDAAPAEIREAYFRAKATYQKDNVALYTLIDPSEREEMLKRVEEAYLVLSNPERRREYDRFYGQLSASPFSSDPMNENGKVISIEDGNPLIAPKTDAKGGFNTHYAGGMATSRREPSAMQTPDQGPEAFPPPPTNPTPAQVLERVIPRELDREIREQTDWSGAFIRRVREARGVSIEEMTLATKITKAYIVAIEEENYAKLPAAVFIRGFVSQMSRLLKLPYQQVSASYMARLQRSCPEKYGR